MKKVALGLFLIMTSFVALSQETYIGQDAQEIKYLVENGTRYNSNTSWDIRYQNGKIADVILCFYKEYLVDVGITADFCKHFIMENNRLAYVITQYETLSLSQLIEAYDKLPNYIKIGDKYYDNDYKNYSIIYLHDNGLATIEWTKTNLGDLPRDMRNKVEKNEEEVSNEKSYGIMLYPPEGYDKIRENLWKLESNISNERGYLDKLIKSLEEENRGKKKLRKEIEYYENSIKEKTLKLNEVRCAFNELRFKYTYDIFGEIDRNRGRMRYKNKWDIKGNNSNGVFKIVGYGEYGDCEIHLKIGNKNYLSCECSDEENSAKLIDEKGNEMIIKFFMPELSGVDINIIDYGDTVDYSSF